MGILYNISLTRQLLAKINVGNTVQCVQWYCTCITWYLLQCCKVKITESSCIIDNWSVLFIRWPHLFCGLWSVLVNQNMHEQRHLKLWVKLAKEGVTLYLRVAQDIFCEIRQTLLNKVGLLGSSAGIYCLVFYSQDIDDLNKIIDTLPQI